MIDTCVLEVCVDDAAGLEAAIAGGADRIELCSGLIVGGLTALPGLMALAAKAPIPVYAMVRPRAGDFVFSPTEIEMMHTDIDLIRSYGLHGVVLGASCTDGQLDIDTLHKLVEHASGLGLTLHRAFDLVPDFTTAIEAAIGLGFERILTSGGAPTAQEGLTALESIARQASERISIMPGAGVTTQNASQIIARTGVHEIHASASSAQHEVTGKLCALGFDASSRRTTSTRLVRALKDALLPPPDTGVRPHCS